MKVRISHLLTAFALILPITTFAQAPVISVLKITDFSNVPASYQGVVKPGSLLYIKGSHGKASHEAATPFALAFNPQTAPVTIAEADMKKATSGSIALSLFGFEPGAKFQHSNQLKFDQIELTGTLISGDQMLDQLNNDPGTKKHLDDDLLRGWHVFIVEGVFKTAELNITTSSGTQAQLTTNKAIEACPTTTSLIVDYEDIHVGGPNLTEPVYVEAATEAGTPGGAAQFCRTSTGTVKLKVNSPIAIGLKLQEVKLYPPNATHPTSYYSFEPVQHMF